jgi:threonine/homoserine/homoserine lactone efflux protein
MTDPNAHDWNDLAKMWQADAAGVSLQDVDSHLRREKRQIWGVAAAELAGLGAGAVAAACVLFFTPHTWMGVVIIVFGGSSAWIAQRLRRAGSPPGSVDALQSLKESIAREDWIVEQLRLGRALSFVALFAIVMATSLQLFRLRAFSAAGLTAAGIACTVILAALAWNLVLTLRAQRRRARLRFFDDRFNDRFNDRRNA